MFDDQHKVFALTLAWVGEADHVAANHVDPAVWARLESDGLVSRSFIRGYVAEPAGVAELLRMIES